MSISDLSLASECQNIEVILKNKVLEKQGSKQGLYRVYKTVNGKASWKSTSLAIWYSPYDNWSVGTLKTIGTGTSSLYSTGNQGYKSPFDVPNDKWQYSNNGFKNAESGDVSIECWNPDKGTVTLHMFYAFMYLQRLCILELR